MPTLEPLAQGVLAWIHDDAGIGRTNSGVIVDVDGVTVVDAQMVPSQAEPLADAVAALGLPVRRCILTSAHIEFVGGNTRFPFSAMYGSRPTSDHLDQPPNRAAYQAFFAGHDAEFAELETRPVSHVIDEAAFLTPAIEVIPIAGHTPGNLVVHVPSAGVVFAGGMCSFGVTPLAFQGHPAAWAAALDLLLRLDVRIVPGHGPAGGHDEVRALQGYLRACVDAHGDPARIPAGPWDEWTDRHLDEINVERAAMIAAGDPSLPPSMARAIGL